MLADSDTSTFKPSTTIKLTPNSNPSPPGMVPFTFSAKLYQPSYLPPPKPKLWRYMPTTKSVSPFAKHWSKWDILGPLLLSWLITSVLSEFLPTQSSNAVLKQWICVSFGLKIAFVRVNFPSIGDPEKIIVPLFYQAPFTFSPQRNSYSLSP